MGRGVGPVCWQVSRLQGWLLKGQVLGVGREPVEKAPALSGAARPRSPGFALR